MASSGTTSGLLRCPKNLKECIDWVLRVAGRDIQTGADNIDNLKNALEAVLNGFKNNSNDLTQLVHGLCLFMGYPSCLCKPKKSVEESLERISEELKEELNFYKCSSISIPNPSLNCNSSCSTSVVCKCCVLDCILKVQKCKCVTNSNNKSCSCSKDDPKRCCKDLLEKLKASLSLLNLKADMEKLCQCPYDSNCCENGVCTGGDSLSCDHCKNLQTSNDYTVTGLGLLRPSPIRLAEKLNEFFGSSGQKPGCSCQCGTSGPSCCCLACQSCSKACSCSSSGSQCPHGSSGPCPRLTFCQNINSIKVASGSRVMKCCDSGKKCHCEIDSNCTASSTSGSSNLKCCIETVTSTGKNFKHSLKCMIRRLVSYFKSLEISSSPQIKNFKNCCELLCVIKTCYFLWSFYNNRTATGCYNCRINGAGGTCPSGGQCCRGPISDCTAPDCCKDCEVCCAVKFSRALEELRFAGPCGQNLYRTLDDFLNFICYVFYPRVKLLENLIKNARDKCGTCNSKTGQHSSCPGCKSGTSGSPSCQGCAQVLTLLQTHKDLLSLMTQGYSSAYSSEASWSSLTSSTSGSGKCCGSLSSPSCSCPSSCSPSGSCPSQCCPDCPQRKATKIFLGMLPCLYYGLKIVFERCDSKNSELWPGWQTKIPEGSIQNFLYAWGIHSYLSHSIQAMVLPGLLENLFTPDSKGSLDKIYDFVSKEYFSKTLPSSPCSSSCPSPSGSSSHVYPSTVRSILLWLYGLRFHKHFSDLVENCKSLCSPFGNSFNADAFCYYIYTSCFLVPVSVISFIQLPDGSPSFLPSHSDWQNFCYPEDPSELLEKLCEYVRKIFTVFDFLTTQCKNYANCGGWMECYFGSKCSVSSGSVSSPSPSGCNCKGHETYLCTWTNSNQTVHKKHCMSGQGCINANGGCKESQTHNKDPKSQTNSGGSNCTPCPHPLQRFLTATSNSQDCPFALPGTTPMGFSQGNLSSTAKSGNSLRAVLKVFCDDGFYPLTRLAEFSLCVSRYPPETLGEFFAFFRKFAEALNSKPELSSRFVQWINDEPGFYSGSDLKTALETLKGSSHSSSHSGSHPYDLFSLNDCRATKASPPTCGPYLYPLIADAYNIFIDDFMDTYLSWVCYSAPTFKEKLKEFKKDFETSCSSCSSGSCQKIVECPCALPKFYKYGFAFASPKGLSGTAKKCSDFLEQLKKFLGLDPNGSTPLSKLLEEIPKFIWSIREPFFFFILAFWAFVISYFLYVQLYKLDLLHLKSHAHLPRSFKILPSTLFSDASSKLKDLSYFTL
ncbi:variant erythrocyte surface antigen-1 family protein [Babesia divergens]|uniref:Variant erythrocyte surface antigen-1 family protein n=1 Tax=Babesia divergens TaxID=32595 RepID=A0AAD9LIU1_BABDI|nr:variant erythrocyte surface antigen-1 family protein [Babesia divergens]